MCRFRLNINFLTVRRKDNNKNQCSLGLARFMYRARFACLSMDRKNVLKHFIALRYNIEKRGRVYE